jgi:hypothetical protein
MKIAAILLFLLSTCIAQDTYPSIPPTEKGLRLVWFGAPREKIKAALAVLYTNPKMLEAQLRMVDNAKGEVTLVVTTGENAR